MPDYFKGIRGIQIHHFVIWVLKYNRKWETQYFFDFISIEEPSFYLPCRLPSILRLPVGQNQGEESPKFKKAVPLRRQLCACNSLRASAPLTFVPWGLASCIWLLALFTEVWWFHFPKNKTFSLFRWDESLYSAHSEPGSGLKLKIKTFVWDREGKNSDFPKCKKENLDFVLAHLKKNPRGPSNPTPSCLDSSRGCHVAPCAPSTFTWQVCFLPPQRSSRRLRSTCLINNWLQPFQCSPLIGWQNCVTYHFVSSVLLDFCMTPPMVSGQWEDHLESSMPLRKAWRRSPS